MKVRFLLDENLSPRLKIAVQRLESGIDIVRVGDSNVLPFGTLDPQVLQYLQLSQRILVTDNRRSMPDHLETHWQQEGRIWGLLWIRPRTPIGQLAEFLSLIWQTTEAEEWINRVEWIPF